MPSFRLTAMVVACSLALAACEDPQPGLEDKARVEKVVSCKDAIGNIARSDKTRGQLCECTTAKLAQQGLTMADLLGDKRDRAMEQLRWCMAQVGIGAKASTPVLEAPIKPEEGAEPDPAPVAAAPTATEPATE